MCTSPLYIPNAIKYKDSPRKLRLQRLGIWQPTVKVPCGKCAECLSKRQNDLAARCVAQARKSGSMQFLTLTYNNDNVPLSALIECVDKESGEVFHDYNLKHCIRKGFEDACRVIIRDLECLPKSGSRFVVKDFFETDEFLYRFVYSFTLNNRDVRLWLKNARVRYERLNGYKLPDFKYVCVGEYGGSTSRPHYHCAFFGLSRSQVQFLADQWQYGFTYLESVNAINQDGTDGFALASKYIGKYMTKGDFDCKNVKDGLCFKGRVMSSKFLGGELDSNLVSYFRCYDLLGEYDINTKLSEQQLSVLLQNVPKRSLISFGQNKFVLPNRFLKQLWYEKDSSGRFKASVVRLQMSCALSSQPLDNYIAEVKRNCPSISFSEMVDKIHEFKRSQEIAFKLRNESRMQSLQKFYLTSYF